MSHYPALNPFESYEDMEDFLATVKDECLAGLLIVAINGRGSFRRFWDILERYPEEGERWFCIEDSRRRERALEWLDDIAISIPKE